MNHIKLLQPRKFTKHYDYNNEVNHIRVNLQTEMYHKMTNIRIVYEIHTYLWVHIDNHSSIPFLSPIL